MAYQYWQQRGEWWRSGFVCLRDSYHGDTIGSVSVGGIELFHSLYRPLLFDAWHAEPGDAADLRALLAEHAERVAAVIVEPLVQGAAGMLVHPDGYLRAVRELCDEYGVFLICDEVATGFGRTGTMFACEQEGVAPDLMCVAKGLTGGYLPLAATLDDRARLRRLPRRARRVPDLLPRPHLHGQPAGLRGGAGDARRLRGRAHARAAAPKIELLGELLAEHVAPLPAVAEVRRRGFMVGIELEGFPLEARMGHQVTLAARERGAIIRPLGDTVVLMPPLSIPAAELRRLVEITAAAIAAAAGAAARPAAAEPHARRAGRHARLADPAWRDLDEAQPRKARRRSRVPRCPPYANAEPGWAAGSCSPSGARRRSVLVGREVALARAAHRAEPVSGMSSNAVPGGMPPSGSPSAGS